MSDAILCNRASLCLGLFPPGGTGSHTESTPRASGGRSYLRGSQGWISQFFAAKKFSFGSGVDYWVNLLTCLSDFSFFCSKLRFRSLDSANASWKSEKKKLLGRIEVLWPLHFEEVGSSTIMMLKRWRDWTCKRVGDL